MDLKVFPFASNFYQSNAMEMFFFSFQPANVQWIKIKGHKPHLNRAIFHYQSTEEKEKTIRSRAKEETPTEREETKICGKSFWRVSDRKYRNMSLNKCTRDEVSHKIEQAFFDGFLLFFHWIFFFIICRYFFFLVLR